MSAKEWIKRVFPGSMYYYMLHKLFWNKESYLHMSGWMRSLKEGKPVDQEGQPTPWMNYPIVHFLQDRLTQDLTLFEFGSGYSTAFYGNLVKEVTSVEYDKEWLARVQTMVPENVTLLYQEQDMDGAYCRSIHTSGQRYDVVIVDGRDRVNCAKQSVQALTERGVILLDDAQRERYAEGIRYMQAQGFRSLSFDGLKPLGTNLDRTIVFYRSNNCLQI